MTDKMRGHAELSQYEIFVAQYILKY
jgi:hypothetical protein